MGTPRLWREGREVETTVGKLDIGYDIYYGG